MGKLSKGVVMFRVKSILAFAITAAFAGTFATAASAGPLQLFPPLFGQQSIPQSAMSYNALPQDQMDRADRFKRQVVDYRTNEAPGTIIVDTPHTYLYFVLGNGRAIRYEIGVGREGFTWTGTQTISRKAEWPDWTPPQEMIQRQPYLPRFMAGGPENPLGARALYLGGTEYRIHGTNAPGTIGGRVSSGCIRLVNDDIVDLYSRVNVGTKVVVLPMEYRAAGASGTRG